MHHWLRAANSAACGGKGATAPCSVLRAPCSVLRVARLRCSSFSTTTHNKPAIPPPGPSASKHCNMYYVCCKKWYRTTLNWRFNVLSAAPCNGLMRFPQPLQPICSVYKLEQPLVESFRIVKIACYSFLFLLGVHFWKQFVHCFIFCFSTWFLIDSVIIRDTVKRTVLYNVRML